MWSAEIVQKLVEKGKHVLAVKYVFEFSLADKIPPVPILKAAVDESRKLARRRSEEGKRRVSVTLIDKIVHGATPYIHCGIFCRWKLLIENCVY